MKKKELEDLLLRGNTNPLPASILGEKESQVLARLSRVMRYLPDEELYPSLLLYLLQFPRQFKRIRSVPHLGRLISAWYFHKKEVTKLTDRAPHKRHLLVKVFSTHLEFPFGTKSVLGLCVTFNLLRPREAFEELHILEAISRILPGVTAVKGSFLESLDRECQVQTVYMEVEREALAEFSLDELKCLEQRIPNEFMGCIQALVPMTFMRRNEEEVYRNIVALRDQLQTITDLPQVTITFEEQTQLDLFFTVVVLRLTQGEVPSIQELFEQLHPDAVFVLDRIHEAGILQDFYKEATVFRLQLSKSCFFRKDRSVNLYKARQVVVDLLTEVLGPIRDFNGGLILKQNEKLQDFLGMMSEVYDEFLLENFFYSVTPIAIQSILPAPMIRDWFLAMTELLEEELAPNEHYQIASKDLEEISLVIVRADETSFKKELLHAVHKLNFPSLELAFAQVNMHGKSCLGFLYRYSLEEKKKEKDLYGAVLAFMQAWSARFSTHQTLRIALHAPEPTLDPRVTKMDQSFVLQQMLFEGITRINSEGKPELAAAESYTCSDDGLVYTFKIRPHEWTNGDPVTAYDFEYSWKKALNPRFSSRFSSVFDAIKAACAARLGRCSLDDVGIYAEDEKTLVVELEYPAAYFLEMLAYWLYLPIHREFDLNHPDWAQSAGKHFASNGPFRLAEWKHGRSMLLERNPSYWDCRSVHLDRIAVSLLKNDLKGRDMLRLDELDLCGSPLTTFTEEFLSRPIEGAEHVAQQVAGVYVLSFNTRAFPFNNRKLRQAFALAFDRGQIARSIAPNFGREAHSLLPESFSLHDTPVFPEGNPEKARSLFNEGLGEIGFVKSDLPTLKLLYFNEGRRAQFLKLLVRRWKEVLDVDVALEAQDWAVYFRNLTLGEYQMGSVDLYARWGDPLHLLEFLEEGDHPFNIPGWEHPVYRSLLQQAKRAATLEERNACLREAEQLVAREMPAVPIHGLELNYLKNQYVKNIFISQYGKIDFKYAKKESP